MCSLVYICATATSAVTTTALRFVRRAYWCVDEQQPAKNEHGQNSANVAWDLAATEQAVRECERVTTVGCQSQPSWDSSRASASLSTTS